MIFLSQACCASKAKKREGMEVWKWFKGRTIKIDFPKQTNRLMYNSDISPVTQRRVWRATNHRNWQSGLHWYNKQVQITLMNIRERGNSGSIRREKDSSEWAKSIKYSSSNLCTLSSTNDTRAFKKHLWEKSSRTHRGQRRDGVMLLLLSLYFTATSTGGSFLSGAKDTCTRAVVETEQRSEEPLQLNSSATWGCERAEWQRMSQGSVTHLTPNRLWWDFVRSRLLEWARS